MIKSSIQDSFINSVLIAEVEMASVKIKILPSLKNIQIIFPKFSYRAVSTNYKCYLNIFISVFALHLNLKSLFSWSLVNVQTVLVRTIQI